MNICTRDVIEGYVLEIISRIRTINRRCDSLLSKDFASDAPINLAKSLINISKYLENTLKSIYQSIDWSNTHKISSSLTLLQTTDSIIAELGSHISYIDGAQTQNLPWSFIKPLEKYFKKFRPDIEIILRPQWEYNYTIITSNLYDFYINVLSRYKIYNKGINLQDVLSPLNKFFYIVSFPYIERKNILLHCLLGHEIGHLEAKEYLQKFEKDFLQSIRNKVFGKISNRLKDPKFKKIPPSLHPRIIQQMLKDGLEETSQIWKHGLEEMLSDIIGSYLFGPAVLFSNLEFAKMDLNGLDRTPDKDNNYYPPWRMRLRNIFDVLIELKVYPIKKDAFSFKKTVNKINKGFKLVEKIVKDNSDINKIKKTDLQNIAYFEINKNIIESKKIFRKKHESLLLNPKYFYKHIPHLIEKLDLGIPPNAYEESINKRSPSTIVEIINATWFYKLAWEDNLFNKKGLFNEEIYLKRDKMNRLALKALEYADIEGDYFQWYFEQKRNYPKLKET